MSSLALTRLHQKRVPEAERLLRQACKIYENLEDVSGSPHPHTAPVLQFLGRLLDAQGKNNEAKTIYLRAEKSEVALRQLNPESAGGRSDT